MLTVFSKKKYINCIRVGDSNLFQLTWANSTHFLIFVHSIFNSNINCGIESIIFVNFLKCLMVYAVISTKSITKYRCFFTIEYLFFHLKPKYKSKWLTQTVSLLSMVDLTAYLIKLPWRPVRKHFHNVSPFTHRICAHVSESKSWFQRKDNKDFHCVYVK